VANALRILALAPPALEMLRSGKISSGHARALLQIKDESKQTALAEKIAAEGLSVRQAEAQAKRISSGKTEKEPKEDPEKIYVQDVERRLTKQLGRKVSIVRGKSKGRFEIEYYGSDDLELVIDALEKLKIDKGGRK
jgi:ParB family chromosome partitioning protein